ncbi:MAG: tetratricopeptide repeat protein [Bacteroidia bacterium]|nr:tetratricopeptide repeat protein [Bacteroidia bacterium]
MSKEAENKQDEYLMDAEVAYTKAEKWIEDNKKPLGYAIVGILTILLGYFVWTKWYIANEEKAAAGEMFQAQNYFEKDSFNLALQGNAKHPGFLNIIEDHPFTKSANLAHYYAGICQLNLGQWDEAIENLESFDSDDKMVAPIAKGGIGDAYMEKGETEQALKYFMQAAELGNNNFVTPIYLMKAAQAQEELGKFDEAVKLYERIKKEYSESQEARDIDKYIARANNLKKA